LIHAKGLPGKEDDSSNPLKMTYLQYLTHASSNTFFTGISQFETIIIFIV